MNILVPLYCDPGPQWDLVTKTRKDSFLNIDVVINVDNGPGKMPRKDYIDGLRKLRENIFNGVELGYVYTSYGKRKINDIYHDSTLWVIYYQVQHKFFDEVPTKWNPKYEEISTNAHSVFNPGAVPNVAYPLNQDARFCMFEDTYKAWLKVKFPAWIYTMWKDRLITLVYDCPTIKDMKNAVALAKKRNIGWLYVTDKGKKGSDPWQELPTYWKEFVKECERPK